MSNGRKWGVTGALMAMLSLAIAGCGGGNAQEAPQGEGGAGEPLQKVEVVLDWTPNTNHTGLYVAKAKGYYEEEGLDVDIIQPGEAGADAVVASGEVPFGISNQESVTLARTQGFPLVSVAAVIQHNTSGFAAPRDHGVKTPKDFEGKTYGGWGSPIEAAMIESLMAETGSDFSKVEIMNIGNSDFFTAMDNGIDFAWIFYAWTGIEAELRGDPVDIVWLTDYSEKLDYYTPALVTNEKLIQEQPELVEKFVRATAKGYNDAAAQPEDAANVLIEAVPELNKELVMASQQWLSPKYIDDAPRWGEQKLEVWENYAAWMTEHGVMEGEFDPSKAYTNDFLPQ